MVANLVAGRNVLRAMEGAVRDARRRAIGVRANLDKLDDFMADIIKQRGHSLVELAQHYLPEMSQATVAKQYSEVRTQLEQLLRKKQQHERDLQRAWDENLDRRAGVENRIDRLTQKLDELADRRSELEQQLATRLKQSTEFQQSSEQALDAENELKRNELRIAEMRQEAQEKLPTYEKSKLFQYLYRRGYGTREYQGKGLTKSLDGWVAKLVKYNKNRQSYNFLRATPELMATEVDRRRDDFNRLMQQIEAMEDEISDEIGLTALLSEGGSLGEQRATELANLERLETERNSIEKNIARLEATENEYYEAGVDRLKQFLGTLNESALELRTKATPQATDDAIFREIKQLNQQLRDARQQSHDDRQLLEVWHDKISGLDQVIRRFRSSEFDSRRSSFSRRFDVDREIDRYLQGNNSVAGLWSVVRQHQQFVNTNYDDSWDGLEGIFDSDVSHVLGRVLIEVAGAAMRQSAQRGMHRRSLPRQQSRRTSGRPTYHRGGGFTSGKGF